MFSVAPLRMPRALASRFELMGNVTGALQVPIASGRFRGQSGAANKCGHCHGLPSAAAMSRHAAIHSDMSMFVLPRPAIAACGTSKLHFVQRIVPGAIITPGFCNPVDGAVAPEQGRATKPRKSQTRLLFEANAAQGGLRLPERPASTRPNSAYAQLIRFS